MHLVALTAVLALAGPTPSIAPPLLARPAAAPAPVAPAVEPERVVLRTQDKLSLVGSYWAPRGKQAAPGALLIHEAGGKRAEMDELAARLHKVGFAVLSIDLRGHGENDTGGDEWSGLEREERERLWAFATRDVVAGTNFLTDQKEVHSSSLVLVGHGAGAALVARHAVKDEDVRAIALLDPPSDKAGTYGFQLDKDLEDLGGLPTYISVPKEGHAAAQRMADDGQRANGGLEFIRISVFRGASAELLSDTREAAEVSKWLKDRAFPSKSRGPR
jgi:pimeloyl-ACP methyl ester carboxylesterase